MSDADPSPGGQPQPPYNAALELRSRIPKSAHGLPLLDYLLQRFRYLDRAAWLAELSAGRLSLDGAIAKAEQRLRAGSELAFHKIQCEPVVSRDLRVVHTSAGYAIVEKPAHLPMHSDGPFVRNTLVHMLRSGSFPEAEIVHRLDRETSGLCVVARTKVARQLLEQQFAAGSVGKTYLALVRGEVANDFVVDAPIGHCAHSSIALRRSAKPDARDPRPARTDFFVQQRQPGVTLLRCVPRTGRTHQIRVHLELAGHALLGDKLYGRPDADYLDFVTRVKTSGDAREVAEGEPNRQLLHASELAFDDPDTGVRVNFTSALPDDFAIWLRPSG
ncbi:MAG TPA: RluA family pseudouridine synthase [Planctomycetota bacterium]|nr:RluA family pseudouridine synthase [Planctomycetota bacterium]